MKKRIIVLGCGLVGAAMARDLAAADGLDVSVADVNRTNLDRVSRTPRLAVVQADLGQADAVKAAVRDVDVVVGAMPSALGLQTLRAVIEAGKHYCDISFMIEDPRELNGLARQRGVTVVYDCGVAPGLANMIIGHCHAGLTETIDVCYYVGGLPKRRHWPFEYKAPFAPSDVVEEYTRPARLKEHGRVVVKPALSEPELIDFEPVGTLEAFNTDGLRSLLDTIPARNMKEKTLRYPGHAELMRVLRETGFFAKEEIDLRGQRIRPIDVTSKLLFDKWRLEPGEPEFTILRVMVEGRRTEGRVRFTYDLYDEYNGISGIHSMARTTGYVCTSMARLIAGGRFDRPGVHPPETIGTEARLLDAVVASLAERGIAIARREQPLKDAD